MDLKSELPHGSPCKYLQRICQSIVEKVLFNVMFLKMGCILVHFHGDNIFVKWLQPLL